MATGLGSELFTLATSFDPYGAYKAGARAPAEQELKDIAVQEQLKEARADLQAPQAPQAGGLGTMARSMMPPGTALEMPDGIPTAAGLLNQQGINAQQDLAMSQKLIKQANLIRTSDPKSYANLVSEARRLQTTATSNIANAKKEYQKSVDDALESVYGANSQGEYDQRVKDALARTGIPMPKGIPEVWTPDIKQKVLSMMSPEARTRIEKEDRARRDEIRKERSAELRDQRLEALLRNGQGGGKEDPATKRVAQSFTQVSDALENVARLPITTTSPVFGQKNFDSIFKAPLSVLNQKMSDETSQKMQTRMVGVARGLASLESGGAATGLVGLTESIQAGVAIPAGAKLEVALDKLAEMRRIVESSGKAILSDPKVSPERKKLIEDEMAIVRKAIPFTQKDIDEADKAAKGLLKDIPESAKEMSFTDFTTKYPVGRKSETSQKEDPLGIR